MGDMRVNQHGGVDHVAEIIDTPVTAVCPNCRVKANLTAVSIPRYNQINRYNLRQVGIVYKCDNCSSPVFGETKVKIRKPDFTLSTDVEILTKPKVEFEFGYLPDSVQRDFEEATDCYSNDNFNAFAAMCRRTVQSASEELGADDSSVQKQIKELRRMSIVGEEEFDQLKQIMLSGHDGAHPQLPPMNKKRADVLLEMMKDTLHELFVRKAKIQESVDLREEAIESMGSAEGMDNGPQSSPVDG